MYKLSSEEIQYWLWRNKNLENISLFSKFLYTIKWKLKEIMYW